MKLYDELRFNDDFMFGKVMEDQELCREVLECLLQCPVGKITELQTEREFKYTSDGKPIRLDVYNKDSEGIIYDAEMENLNKKSVESHELPRRSRFYQSSIDIDFMDKGYSYRCLPESKIMFICTFDPCSIGLAKYTFRECCDEAPKLKLKDGTERIFYNCCYKGNDIPDNLMKFYNYINTGKASSDLTRKIETAVIAARKNEVWRTQYVKEMTIIQDAIYYEHLETEKQKKKAAKEKKRADTATQRADAEAQRADAAIQRAEKAELELSKLKAALASK